MIEKNEEMPDWRGLGWRVSLSILVGVGWLVFLILWLFFYATGYNIYQNIAIFLASIAIAFGLLGAGWASWGLSFGARKGLKGTGFGWRASLSSILGAAIFAFIVVWLFFYAGGYSVYQNIAVLLAAVLIVGGVLGAVWAAWGMKFGGRCDDLKD